MQSNYIPKRLFQDGWAPFSVFQGQTNQNGIITSAKDWFTGLKGHFGHVTKEGEKKLLIDFQVCQ